MLTIGQHVSPSRDFTTPIGTHFKEGSDFIVETVGTVNARARSVQCGTLVWLVLRMDGSASFFTGNGY